MKSLYCQYTDEEVVQNYEDFFEDVHGEFLKHGEIINFKVCRNESSHLRGNVYAQFQSVDSAVTAYNALNGRFFAGKQITCEFVVVTRWRAALCGEYMRSHHKVCSHGTACNFLHCFKNPYSLYDWADWDNPPPRSFKAKGRRSRGDLREEAIYQDKDDHRHGDGLSHRRHRDDFCPRSRRSHQTSGDRVSRYKGRHSNESSSEESLSVEIEGLQKDKRRRSSYKRSREKGPDIKEDGSTKNKEDSRKQRHWSRSQDRYKRKRHGVCHDASRTRGITDKRSATQRGRRSRSRSHESSESQGGTLCEETQRNRQHARNRRCSGDERYKPRSRSLGHDSVEGSPEDEMATQRNRQHTRNRCSGGDERYKPRSRSLSRDSVEESPEDDMATRRRSSSDRRKRKLS